MMVAPLFAGEASRKVILPEGAWHDFWTGEVLKGGTEVTVPASSEKIPVYVRSGSLVPWADVGPFAGAPPTRRIAVRVYGDGSLPFTLKNGTKDIRLSWANGRGKVEGETGQYDVYTWERLG